MSQCHNIMEAGLRLPDFSCFIQIQRGDDRIGLPPRKTLKAALMQLREYDGLLLRKGTQESDGTWSNRVAKIDFDGEVSLLVDGKWTNDLKVSRPSTFLRWMETGEGNMGVISMSVEADKAAQPADAHVSTDETVTPVRVGRSQKTRLNPVADSGSDPFIE